MANNWDCVEQFRDRVSCLRSRHSIAFPIHSNDKCTDIGHKVDKIEVLVLGGTWSFYPEDYQKNFIRVLEFCERLGFDFQLKDIYYAANTLDDPPQERRFPLGLKEEQKINEGAR